MSSNSEARKRQHEVEVALAAHERRREVVQQALEAVMSGASYLDADAFLDHLGDQGAAVVVS